MIGVSVCVYVNLCIGGFMVKSGTVERGWSREAGRDADAEETLNSQEITTEEIELKAAKYRPQDLFHYLPFLHLLSLSPLLSSFISLFSLTQLSKKINENKTRQAQGGNEKRKHTISGDDKEESQRFNHTVRNILALGIRTDKAECSGLVVVLEVFFVVCVRIYVKINQ